MQNAKLKIKNAVLIFCLLPFAFCLLPACSIPNLEKPECAEARQTVKEFYSYHFGNDMQFTPENLRQREKFLTNDFAKNLRDATPQTTGEDPFTLTADTPKAFRVGGCETVEPSKKVNFQILLFWKTESRSEQREIYAEVVKENGKWLINKIFKR